MSVDHAKTFQKGLLLALFGGLVLSAACGAAPTVPASDPLVPITVKLYWTHSIQFLGYYAAQEHYYAAEGLSVTLEPLSTTDEQGQVLAQLVAGDFLYAVGGDAVAIESTDAPVTAIAAIYQQSPLAFFARTDSGIVTPADLAGRLVAVKSDAWQLLLTELLQREGLDLDDIQPVPAGFDMTPFYQGEVEVWAGYITNEAVHARLQGLELITLPLYEYGLGSYANMIFTSQSALEADPDLAVRFLRASLRGWEWAIDHPVEAVDLMLARFPELEPERDFHLDSFKASIPLVRSGGVLVGSLDCQSWVGELTTVSPVLREQYCSNQILETVLQTRTANSDQ